LDTPSYHGAVSFNLQGFRQGTGRQNILDTTVVSIPEFNLILIPSTMQF